MRSAVLVALFLSMMVVASQAWGGGRQRGRRPWDEGDEEEEPNGWEDEEESWLPNGGREGEACNPPVKKTCGEPELVDIEVEQCDSDFGENVCNFELTFEVQTLAFEYSKRCFFGNRGCVSLCSCTGACRGQKMMVVRRFVDCCEGFTTTPFINYAIESMEEGEEFRPPSRLTMLRDEGCPIPICVDEPEEGEEPDDEGEEPEGGVPGDDDDDEEEGEGPGDEGTDAPEPEGTDAPEPEGTDPPFVPPNFTDDGNPESG